jgi:hypothetical protein
MAFAESRIIQVSGSVQVTLMSTGLALVGGRAPIPALPMPEEGRAFSLKATSE